MYYRRGLQLPVLFILVFIAGIFIGSNTRAFCLFCTEQLEPSDKSYPVHEQLAVPQMHDDPCPMQPAEYISHIPARAPTSVTEARELLQKTLTSVWDLDRDDAIFADPVKVSGARQITSQRAMLDLFVGELASQLPSRITGPVCMDWDERYSPRFPGCESVVGFAYKDAALVYKPATQNLSTGMISGDLGSNTSHLPSGIIDFIICTQVLEHVPKFWNALSHIAHVLKPNGALLFSVPFSYRFHALPGDFYRFSPMAAIHLLESSGFAVCHIVSDGWRTYQTHALSLGSDDIHSSYLTTQKKESQTKGAKNINIIAQLTSERNKSCDLGAAISLTNEITCEDVREASKGWFPKPSSEF